MTTPAADPGPLREPVAVPPGEQLLEARRDPLGVFVLIALAVLIVVMAIQTVYLLSYGTTIREQQDALVCQARQTSQLRDAATLERQGQRDLLTVQVDPTATPEQRQAIGRAAVQKYLAALEQSDAERAAVPPCPTLDALSPGDGA